ncbi:MAG: insulinase family protein [Bacteroidota bacterium]
MRNLLYALLAVLLFADCSPKTGEPIFEPTESGPHPEVIQPEDEVSTTDPDNFRAQAPKPGEAREIKIGTYETFKLDNGLTVILVENHKIPRISWQLSLDYDPILEGEKAGYTSMAGDLLMSGTENRTKAELDEAVDFLGASLSAGAGGMFASSLTRHSQTVLELMTDVLYNPTFPEAEFEKLKTQTLSGIQSSKDDPNTISANVGDKLNYGGDHPYGELVTEETVNNISVDDCKAFYNNYYRPNIA